MSLALLLTFIQFQIVMAFTPGPNNMMVAASAVNFGFKKTIPHMLGIAFGFSFMFFAAGLGFGKIFETFPILYEILKIIGFIYLLYLAWKIAQFKADVESEIKTDEAASQPFSFLQALMFQWANPKAWTVLMISITTYTSLSLSTPLWLQVTILSFISFIVTLPAVCTWTFFGSAISPLLQNTKLRKIFNITMALLIVMSVVMANYFAGDF